jgi:hypothetical protein
VETDSAQLATNGNNENANICCLLHGSHAGHAMPAIAGMQTNHTHSSKGKAMPEDSLFTPLLPEEAPTESRELLEQARRYFGFIPNLLASMAHSPMALSVYFHANMVRRTTAVFGPALPEHDDLFGLGSSNSGPR